MLVVVLMEAMEVVMVVLGIRVMGEVVLVLVLARRHPRIVPPLDSRTEARVWLRVRLRVRGGCAIVSLCPRTAVGLVTQSLVTAEGMLRGLSGRGRLLRPCIHILHTTAVVIAEGLKACQCRLHGAHPGPPILCCRCSGILVLVVVVLLQPADSGH